MIEESLLKRGPAPGGVVARDLADLMDPAAFEERLREARARRAVALASRAATGPAPTPRPMRATPPIFPAPPGAFEPEAPVLPCRARAEAPPPAARPASPPRAAATRPPRIEVTPGPELRPRASLLTAATSLPRRAAGFARSHVALLGASVLALGLALGAGGLWIGSARAPDAGDAPGRTAAAPPPPPASPAPETAPPAAEALPTASPRPPLPASSAPPLPVAATVELLPEPDPGQMPSPEPDLAPVAPAAIAAPGTAALSDRPRPRPAGIAALPPAAADAFAGSRVVVNLPSGRVEGNPDATIALISAAGFPKVERARVDVDMTRPQVRYFHAADAGAARVLADATGAIARDFTTHTPPPKTGYLELWLAGTGAHRAARQPAPEDRILGILRDRAASN